MRCPYPAQFAFNSLEGKRDKHWDILVVSARLENKMALLRILQGLPVSAFTAPTVQQAHEVLSTHSIRVIFCEENFADGSYRDLLAAVRTSQIRTPLVLMLSTGEWEEYLEEPGRDRSASLSARAHGRRTHFDPRSPRARRAKRRPVQKAPTTPLIDGGAVPPPIRTSLADGNMENQRQTPKLVCPRCGSDWVCQSWRNGISARLLRSRGFYVAGSE
jgi:hypothetical protein